MLQGNIRHSVSNLKSKITLDTLCSKGLNLTESSSFSLVPHLSLVVTCVFHVEIYKIVIEFYINQNLGQMNLLDLIPTVP